MRGKSEGVRKGERRGWEGVEKRTEEERRDKMRREHRAAPLYSYPQYQKPLEAPSGADALPGMTGKGFQCPLSCL